MTNSSTAETTATDTTAMEDMCRVTVAMVETIGRNVENITYRAEQILAHPANDDRDWSARGAIAAAIRAVVGETNKPLTTTVGEGEDARKVDTDYGRGFRALSDKIRNLRAAETKRMKALAADESSADESSADAPADETPDYMALAIQAAATAVDNGVDPSALLDALTGILTVRAVAA